MSWLSGALQLHVALILPLLYFAYAFLGTFGNYLGGGLAKEGFVFWGKEFLYYGFFVGSYLTWLHRPTWLVWAAVSSSCVLLAYGIGQLISTPLGYYGLAAPGVSNSPSLSGFTFVGFSFLLVVVSQILPNVGRRRFLVLLAFLLSLCAVLTLSRSTMGMGIVFFGTLWISGQRILSARPRLEINRLIFRNLMTAAVLAGIVFPLSKIVFSSELKTEAPLAGKVGLSMVAYRIAYLPEGVEDRLSGFRGYLSKVHGPLDAISGLGRGALNMENGELIKFTLGGDNQYVRNSVEIGYLGTILWLIIVLSYLILLRSHVLRRLYCALLLAFLTGGLGAEVFQLSKSGALFWAMLGVLVATDHLQRGLIRGQNEAPFLPPQPTPK